MEHEQIEFVESNGGISTVKDNGTIVDYFLFDTFEIHKNVVPGGCVQDWHSHQKIEEVVLLNEGELYVEWLDNEEVHSRKIEAGGILRLKNSIHRLLNKCGEPADLTIFRFVSPSESQAETIKHDKKIYSDNEIKSLIYS